MIQRLKDSFWGRVATKFGADMAPNWAVQIAWSSLLAMFPIILVTAGVLGLIFSLAGVGGEDVRRNLAAVFPHGDAQNQVALAVEQFKRQSGVFALVGFLGLLVGGSALFGTMDQAFAAVYHVRRRSLLDQRLMSVGMILVFTVLVGLAVGSSSVLPALKDLVGTVPFGFTHGLLALVLQFAIGTVSAFIFFAATYYVVPNRRQAWRQVVPGALLAGLLLECVTLAFPLYLSLNKGVESYGKTFGLLFVLMAFFFFLGLITMVGVEVNSVHYPVDPKPVARAGVAAADGTAEGGAAMVAGESSDPNGKLVSGGLRAVLGAGVIGWAIGVATARRMGR